VKRSYDCLRTKLYRRRTLALSKNLKALKADETQVKKLATAAVVYIGACFFVPNTSTIAELPVSQFGDTTEGFLFGTSGTVATPRTALDINTVSPGARLQEVNAACLSGSTTALGHNAARLQRWARHSR